MSKLQYFPKSKLLETQGPFINASHLQKCRIYWQIHHDQIIRRVRRLFCLVNGFSRLRTAHQQRAVQTIFIVTKLVHATHAAVVLPLLKRYFNARTAEIIIELKRCDYLVLFCACVKKCIIEEKFCKKNLTYR